MSDARLLDESPPQLGTQSSGVSATLQECSPVSSKARLIGHERVVSILAQLPLDTYTEEGDEGYL